MTGGPTAVTFDDLVARARRMLDRATPQAARGFEQVTPSPSAAPDVERVPSPSSAVRGIEQEPSSPPTAGGSASHRPGTAGAIGRVLLGIAGPPGAGKSTLVAALVSALDAESSGTARQVPMDGLHLADAELARLGRLDRKGAPDTFDAAGYVALLMRLRTPVAATVYAPAFDRSIEQPIAGSIPVDPDVRLVVTEGNYLLEGGDWAGVRPLLDEVWWVDAADEEREHRLTARHEGTGRSPEAALAWARDVDGANARRIAPSRSRADLVVPGDLVLPDTGLPAER